MILRDVRLARGDLSALLQWMRERTGETRKDAAELMRIGKYRIEAYERGQALPNIATLLKIVRHYGYTILIVKEDWLDEKTKTELLP